MQKTSIQYPRSGVEEAHTSTPLSSIEIARPIYDQLNEICLVEHISIKILVQRLLSHMLVYHKQEVIELSKRIRHPEGW